MAARRSWSRVFTELTENGFALKKDDQQCNRVSISLTLSPLTKSLNQHSQQELLSHQVSSVASLEVRYSIQLSYGPTKLFHDKATISNPTLSNHSGMNRTSIHC